MIRGYRGIVAAALGLILAANHPNTTIQPKQTDAQDRSAKALEDIAARYQDQAKRSNGSRETEPCENGESKRYSDLCAQWKAANAAELSAWFNLASIAAVLVALFLAFRSNSIARATAHNQLRAYVTLGTVGMQFRSTGADVKRWHIDVDLENSGQTPAFLRHFSIDIGWRRKGVAADIIDPAFSKSRDIKVVVASGKPFGVSIEIDRSEFSPAPLQAGDDLAIIGKIDYLDIYGESRTTSYRLYADQNSWEKGAGAVAIYTSMTGNNCT